MPSTTAKQERFMGAVAHGWKPDRVDAPPVAVAQEFNDADKAKHKRRAVVRALRGTGSISSEGSAVGSASA
jgi:hypothetical protein